MTKTQSKNIGLSFLAPKKNCEDQNCPFHGGLSVRGRQFKGTVVSTKMRKSAIVEFERIYYLKKFERYEKRRTKLKVHNPECMGVNDGDMVTVVECRPLSKTKNFVIVKILGKEKGFAGKMEGRESAKADKATKEEKDEHKTQDKKPEGED
jgi:small subunit ribosomal protein S17